MVNDIKKNLTNIVVIIGLIGSIGAGFVKYGEVMTKIDVLENASKTVDIDYSAQIAVIEEKIAALESKKEVDVSGIDTRSKINEKSIKLLELKIEELKAASNPLGG